MAPFAWTLPLAGLCGLVAVVYWVVRGQNPVKGLGLWPHGWMIIDLIAGVGISFMALLGIFLIEWLLGGIRIDGAEFDTAALLSAAQSAALSAGFEEFVRRSLLLNGLQIVLGLVLGLLFGGRRRLGERTDRGLLWASWPAVLLAAAGFGYLQLTTPGGTWLTAAGIALGAVMYGVAFVGGRNLWLPIGLHFGWNFVQGAVLGFPVGGLDEGGVVQQQPVETVSLITGGAYGPDAGVVGMALRLVAVVMVIGYLQWRCDSQGKVATLAFPIRSYRNPPRR
jgi:membrane protease YdiL (CAAX protease family)